MLRMGLRKRAEFALVPVAEFVLGKQRILELYLNVVEWGPGIYGVESARLRSPSPASCATRLGAGAYRILRRKDSTAAASS